MQIVDIDVKYILLFIAGSVFCNVVVYCVIDVKDWLVMVHVVGFLTYFLYNLPQPGAVVDIFCELNCIRIFNM